MIDKMYAAGLKRACPGGEVVDGDRLDNIEMSPVFLPVIRIALRNDAHAGLKCLDDIASRADRGVGVRLVRHDQHVIIGEEIR